MYWKSWPIFLAAIGTVQSQNISHPVLDFGYAKYKGTYNESLR